MYNTNNMKVILFYETSYTEFRIINIINNETKETVFTVETFDKITQISDIIYYNEDLNLSYDFLVKLIIKTVRNNMKKIKNNIIGEVKNESGFN